MCFPGWVFFFFEIVVWIGGSSSCGLITDVLGGTAFCDCSRTHLSAQLNTNSWAMSGEAMTHVQGILLPLSHAVLQDSSVPTPARSCFYFPWALTSHRGPTAQFVKNTNACGLSTWPWRHWPSFGGCLEPVQSRRGADLASCSTCCCLGQFHPHPPTTTPLWTSHEMPSFMMSTCKRKVLG